MRTISFSSLLMFVEVVTALVGVLGLSCMKEGLVVEVLDTARERPEREWGCIHDEERAEDSFSPIKL